MSETASTARAPAALLPSLAPLLHEWLPRRRWFAGKGEPVTGFTLVSATELLPPGAAGPGLLHLLVRVRQPGADVPPAPPGDCYQLLLGVCDTLPPRLAPALVGRATRGPLAGRTVYEALQDPRLASLLLERLRSPGAAGPLSFHRAAAVPGGLPLRVLDAEQSNTSLVYGDAYILKVFRRIHPGANPDLELPLALARSGCPRVPAPVAWYEAGSGPDGSTLGVLQPYLRGSRDGWRLALDALAAGRDFAPEAHALGRATAEVHTALARALPTAALTRRRARELAVAMSRRLDAAARAVPALVPYVPGLRAAFEAVAALAGDGARHVQRVHGDLHLGQVLRTPDGEWSVIDFEGEPAKPLAERRRPQPPVRDVAGMLRSFDYAAHSHHPRRPGWAERCREAYCSGYADASGRDPRADGALLRAYETDKAVYEVVYEARHRPDWLRVPMAAVRRLASPPDADPVPPSSGRALSGSPRSSPDRLD
ncbi:phosphotransferase [Streptomyces sp. MRC013]|uniref:maltokinase N-terminal cap-like domain-containing protein n=1 Tax=Streptomyces sp. MRC013 TaxID=2898276 RepID=UPI00202666C3|nr:phosphotransferase [Streptomyces sp. MRC013]URM89550.1 phosphotransferase [Streptomyces sp. MRC013]